MAKKSVRAQKIINKKGFSKKEAIGFGFGLAKKNLIFFLGVFMVILLVHLVLTIIRFPAGHVFPVSIILWILLLPVQTVIDLMIGTGLIRIALKFIDNKKPAYKDLFNYQAVETLINYFLTSFLVALIVLGGLILLIIPGIFFAYRLKFAPYLVIDKNLAPAEAIQASWRITKGSVWNLFFFGILLGLINILGFFCLIVGLFVTIPLGMLATAFVYRRLLLQSKAA
jgi:uncharacterized membrane protein